MAEYDPKLEILNAAAMHIIDARKVLRRCSGVKLPDTGGFTSACTRITAPGVRCGCDEYTGDGGECRTRFADHSEGDFGTEPALVERNHPALEHFYGDRSVSGS